MQSMHVVVMIAWLLVALGLGVLFAVRRRKRLAAIGEFLGGSSDSRSAWGSALGAHATLRWRYGDRDDRQNWTEVTAELPPQLPFLMALRPQGWLDGIRIDRGSLVDVVVGDEAFDAAYVIEAAPADVVRALLTPARRAVLAGYGKIELETKPGPPRLRMRIPTVLDELDAAKAALEVVVDLALGVREAYAEMEAAVDQPRVGAPFREQRGSGGEREAAQRRIDEVRTLRARRSRSLSLGSIVVLSVSLWLLATVGLMWFAQRW